MVLRRVIITGILGLLVFNVKGQPVKWAVTIRQVTVGRYMLSAAAKVENRWYVYADSSSYFGLDGVQFQFENQQVSQGKITVSPAPVIIKDPVFENHQLAVFKGDFSISREVTFKGKPPANLAVTVTGFCSNGTAFLPFEQMASITLSEDAVEVLSQNMRIKGLGPGRPVSDCGAAPAAVTKGIGELFLTGIAGGLLALLTPCVFPMVPVTVGFFTGRAKDKRQGIRNGILYGLCILLVYLSVSLPFHLLSHVNPSIFNTIATSVWVNLLFFTVFVIFALSFFGLFELSLPSTLASRMDRRSSAANLPGIFFMALTLAVVSFSCTGPILGSLLVGSMAGREGAWQLTAALAGFGLALSLPFGLFAIFPEWLKRLPKSGGWLNTVKKTLAFVELALALKFFSNADLVGHWGIVKREIFIAAWMLISLTLGLFLLGIFNRKTKSRPNAVQLTLGIGALLFAAYLAPGLMRTKYTDLQLLSGMAPPLSYSIYPENKVAPENINPDVINDYAKAVAMAKQTGKPLLIDFTGWACVNCRKMEEEVWTKPEIRALIKEKYILVSLYVDDRQKLPAHEQFVYKTGEGKADREIVTIGDKWSTFETVNFAQASQPLYVLLSPEEKLLTNPTGYLPDEIKYKKWLQCGIDSYEEIKTNEK